MVRQREAAAGAVKIVKDSDDEFIGRRWSGPSPRGVYGVYHPARYWVEADGKRVGAIRCTNTAVYPGEDTGWTVWEVHDGQIQCDRETSREFRYLRHAKDYVLEHFGGGQIG